MFDYHACKQTHFDNACLAFALKYKGELKQIAGRISMNEQMLRNKLNPQQPHQLTCADLIHLTEATKDPILLDGVLEKLKCQPSVPLNNLCASKFYAHVLNATAEVGKLASQAVLAGKVNNTRCAEIKPCVNNAIRCLTLAGITLSTRLHSIPALVATADTVAGLSASIM